MQRSAPGISLARRLQYPALEMNAVRIYDEPGPVETEQRSVAELLQTLSKAAERLAELDARHASADDAAVYALAEDVAALLTDVLSTLTALELAVQAKVEQRLDVAAEVDTRVGLRATSAEPVRLEDVCFVAGLELSRALGGLVVASGRDSLLALESAIRKLYRVLHAVLHGARSIAGAPLESDVQLERRLAVELESALAVRRMFGRFRRSLRRAESDERHAVLTALRYAAGALASLVASPHYQALRASDRELLRRQRDRLLEWAHAGNPTSAGLQLLDDIFTSADLLRGVEGRQELRDHDAKLIRELIADTTRDRAAWLVELERLSGMDETLDALTAQLAAASDLGPVVAILVRLSFLIDG
ncbi:MAG TPA: hypothetical protein VEQ58_12335 [Polyangiaceae bacterium]|nr:hypothetical protein [Polyangiaceae bacterium]